MGWQLGPARADDEEKMPTARAPLHSERFGVPGDLHHYLSLCVDGLVKYCHEFGYAMADSNGVPNTKPRSMQRPVWQLGLG